MLLLKHLSWEQFNGLSAGAASFPAGNLFHSIDLGMLICSQPHKRNWEFYQIFLGKLL